MNMLSYGFLDEATGDLKESKSPLVINPAKNSFSL